MAISSENSSKLSWQIKGLKRHHLIQFPLLKEKRRESIKETLSGLSGEESHITNENHFPRTTHLYKSDTKMLLSIMNEISNNENFVSCEIIHESSDLGLTHYLHAEHRNGSSLFFDGLIIRVTREISSDTVKLDQLLSLTGVPRPEWDTITNFVECSKKVNDKQDIYGNSFYNYYTVTETNWKELGLKREGKAQICLNMFDPNFHTITAMIFSEVGKGFRIYLVIATK